MRLAAIDRLHRPVAARRVRHALRRGAFDELDVEPFPLEQLVSAGAVEDDAGQIVGGLVDRCSAHAVDILCKPVRGEDRQAFLARRDENDHHPRAPLASVLVVEGERRLIPVMSVRDQQLQSGDVGHAVDAPQAIATGFEVGRARRDRRRGAVVEKEDRLELRPRRAQQPQAPLLRGSMCPLMREHDTAFVGLDPQRDDVAVPRALDPVGTDIGLRKRPARRLVAREDAGVAPRGEVGGRLLLGIRQGQVHDVVRTAAEVLQPLVRRDHVVRRRDERCERAGLGFVVAQCRKRPDLRHRAEPSIRRRT